MIISYVYVYTYTCINDMIPPHNDVGISNDMVYQFSYDPRIGSTLKETLRKRIKEIKGPYPLVNVQKNWKTTIFHGKTYYINGNVQ